MLGIRMDFFFGTCHVPSTPMERTMPKLRKMFGFAMLFSGLVLIPTAHADTITFGSASTSADSSQTNSNGANVAITKNSAWSNPLAGSSWVSFTTSGDASASNFVTVANGTVVNFLDTFTLSGPATSGTLAVMADDSATVLLNGVALISETIAKNTYAICSDFGVGCLQPTIIDLPVSLLKSGSNTLEFQVAQRAGSSFGLDYLATIVDPVATPEASTGAMLILSVAAIAMFGLIRKSSFSL
jgi:hypothetical protein